MIDLSCARRGLGVALASLALATTACNPTPKNPTLQIADATFTGVQVKLAPVSLQMMLAMKVNATNPNAIDLKIREVRGTVTLAGRYPLPVTMQPDVWLPAGRTTPFDVPVVVPVDTAARLVGEVVTSDCISYEFVGSVDVTATSTLRLERDGYPLTNRGCVSRLTLLQLLKQR